VGFRLTALRADRISGVVKQFAVNLLTTPFKRRRRSFATAQLSDERVQAIAASRMDERHAHLDAVLEPNSLRKD
jgi:hypothetical protein